MIVLPESWRGRALVLESFDSESFDGNARDWLGDDELSTAGAFTLPTRRAEWILSRVAAKQLARARGYVGDVRALAIARPRLATGEYVSLSHSNGVAAVAIDDEPVGIDVEQLRDVNDRIAARFLCDDEREAVSCCTLPHRLLHWWTAKEAVWKRDSTHVRFLKDFTLAVEAEQATGLRFDGVETFAGGDLVVALTRRR
jgi:4'-phosphopantetheinyl transferase EntD